MVSVKDCGNISIYSTVFFADFYSECGVARRCCSIEILANDGMMGFGLDSLF